MKLGPRSLPLFSLLAFFALSSHSAEKFKIVTFPIPGLHDDDKKSPGVGLDIFNSLFLNLEKATGLKLDLQMLPPIRAHEKFRSGEANAIFPAFEEEIKGDFQKSVCFARKVDYFFHLKGHDPKKVLAEESFKVSITRGYFHPSKTIARFKNHLVVVNSTDAGMKMLANKRVDLFLVDNISAVSSLLKRDFPDITFDPQAPVDATCAYFWTGKDNKSAQFLASLNKEIKSQKLASFFKKAFNKKIQELNQARSNKN